MQIHTARSLVRAINHAHLEPDEPVQPELRDATLTDMVLAAGHVELDNPKRALMSQLEVPSERRIARVYLLKQERPRAEPVAHLQGKSLYIRSYVASELETA